MADALFVIDAGGCIRVVNHSVREVFGYGDGDLIGRSIDRLEERLGEGPYFDGGRFGLVDAAFAPPFRYFDLFDRIAGPGLFAGKPKLQAWRKALSERSSVRGAVAATYADDLRDFILARGSHLARLIEPALAA